MLLFWGVVAWVVAWVVVQAIRGSSSAKTGTIPRRSSRRASLDAEE
jgi:hypothetical protein